MTSIVNKVPAGESTDEKLTMLIDWKCDGFDILVMQNQSAWQGSASSDHVKELSQNVGMTVEDYINETKTALSTLGGMEQFSYHVVDNQFVWKKVVQDIKVKFGYVLLEEASYSESSGKVLDALMQQNCCLQLEVDGLQNANKRSTAERIVLMEKLVEYKKQKLELEQTLYSQFVAVLNKKKRVLQQVQEDDGVNGNKVPSSTMSDSPEHYDSDTEVENTDNEERDSPGKISDEELFETDVKSTTFIPKRVGRQKRISEQSLTKPGPSNKRPGPSKKRPCPSMKRPFITKESDPTPDTTNTQDLWDDL